MAFGGIGFGTERVGLASLKAPRIAGQCIFVLCVVIGARLPRVSFDSDIHRVFLSDSPLLQAQMAYEAAQTPPLTTPLIHVTAPAVLKADQMTALRDL